MWWKAQNRTLMPCTPRDLSVQSEFQFQPLHEHTKSGLDLVCCGLSSWRGAAPGEGPLVLVGPNRWGWVGWLVGVLYCGHGGSNSDTPFLFFFGTQVGPPVIARSIHRHGTQHEHCRTCGGRDVREGARGEPLSFWCARDGCSFTFTPLSRSPRLNSIQPLPDSSQIESRLRSFLTSTGSRKHSPPKCSRRV